MHKHLAVCVALLVCAPCFAQEAQTFKRTELFTGYQFVHVYPAENGSGWNFALTGNVTRFFGLTGEFSGAYEHGSSLYTYMVGPHLAARGRRLTPFVHVLFGGAHTDGLNAFSLAAGGGLDVNAGEHFSLRLVQGDWISFHRAGESLNSNARVSVGPVFRF